MALPRVKKEELKIPLEHYRGILLPKHYSREIEEIEDSGAWLKTPSFGLNTSFSFFQATLTTQKTALCSCSNCGAAKWLCGRYLTGRVCGGDSGGSLAADRDADGRWG